MAQKYKIFLNEKLLILEHQRKTIKRNKIKLITSPQELLEEVILLDNNPELSELKLHSSEPLERLLSDSFKTVKAAGGIVYKGSSQLLFIKRFDMWDLPKGKLKKHEDAWQGALREVTEETALTGLSITEYAGSTLHLYMLRGHYHLKETTWYNMSYVGDETPVPQLEESITEVKWVDLISASNLIALTYRSLQDLLNYSLEKKKKEGLTARDQ